MSMTFTRSSGINYSPLSVHTVFHNKHENNCFAPTGLGVLEPSESEGFEANGLEAVLT